MPLPLGGPISTLRGGWRPSVAVLTDDSGFRTSSQLDLVGMDAWPQAGLRMPNPFLPQALTCLLCSSTMDVASLVKPNSLQETPSKGFCRDISLPSSPSVSFLIKVTIPAPTTRLSIYWPVVGEESELGFGIIMSVTLGYADTVAIGPGLIRNVTNKANKKVTTKASTK